MIWNVVSCWDVGDVTCGVSCEMFRVWRVTCDTERVSVDIRYVSFDVGRVTHDVYRVTFKRVTLNV